jgi:uncharacterized membrane protein YidH (DUF202 family)
MLDQEIRRDRIIETYRSMISHSSAAVKAVMLINGGSAIALLAFMRNIWKPETAGQMPDIILPMVLFVFGLFLAAFAAGTSYLTQFTFYREDLGYSIDRWWKKHSLWLYISVGSFFLGLFFFVAGGVFAAVRIFN